MNSATTNGSRKHPVLLPIKLASISTSSARIEWDWDFEHADRKKEAIADAALHGAHPFQVDRKVLKDVVWEKSGTEVGRITFLSSGMRQHCYHHHIPSLSFRRHFPQGAPSVVGANYCF
jgi:hypothetical protein